MRHRQKDCLMTIPYRVRRGLQRFLIIVCVLAVLSAAAFGAWMLWLSRFVVYTDEGAKLDFNHTFDAWDGEIAKPPASSAPVDIIYTDPEDSTLPPNALTQMEGWVVTADMLTEKNFAATKAALDSLLPESTVLVDVRNVRGEFFYDSDLGRTAGQVDAAAVSQLFQDLQAKNCYLIARFPAFRDRWYFLEDEIARVPYGLALKGGNGSLWEDVSVPNMSHYWFDPTEAGTQNFLVQIISELKDQGFDEVVFSDFRFPNTDKVSFAQDRTQALNDTAKTLVQACANDGFTVSFTGSHVTLPEGRCRIYLENVAAADIAAIAESLALENPQAQLVFLTDLMDTRYQEYSVLRPLEVAT